MVIEPSVIVREGITSIVTREKTDVELSFVSSVDEAFQLGQPELFKLVLVNPSMINHSKKNLKRLPALFGKEKLIGLVSTLYERVMLDYFSDAIFITDDRETILRIFSKHLKGSPNTGENDTSLSERETEVLKLLATGKSNKEIAEELFISIHTVVSHRKNISTKLGVKSAAALVIYAVANGLIDVDNYSE